GAGVHDQVADPQLGQGAVQPEAVAAGLGAGADRGVRRQPEALLGLGDLLLECVEVARRQGAEAGLLGGPGGAGEQPLVPAELQGEVQGPRRGRRCGHGSFSVGKVTGVLPDGDWYHLRYLAGYMVSNEIAQPPGPLAGLHTTKNHKAAPVCCSAWFGGSLTASQAGQPGG